MADIVVERNGKLVYMQSVNTPDYPTAIVNPDLSALQGVPIKYWKIVAGAVVEMTQSEKNVVDAAIAAETDAAKSNYQILTVIALAKALVKKGVLTKAQIVAEI